MAHVSKEGTGSEELMTGSSRAARYDAFISYSHAADGKLAPALRSALLRFAKSWYALRALRVFLDQTSLSATPELWPTIVNALGESKFFLFMASPQSAQSPWVAKEVDWWLDNRSIETLLIILTDGELAWDNQNNDFDWAITNCLPETLREIFQNEPLWVDLRWARNESDLSLRHTKFRAAVLDIAAPLHNRPKDELDGKDVIQHRRFRLVAATAGILLAALAVIASYTGYRAVKNAHEADTQRRVAVSRQLSVQSTSLLNNRYDLALLLAVQATREAKTVEAQQSLLQSLTDNWRPWTFFKLADKPVSALAISADGQILAVSNLSSVSLFDRKTSELHVLSGVQQKNVQQLAFSSDGKWLTSVYLNGTVIRWDTTTLQVHATWETKHNALWPPFFSHDGKRLITGVRNDKLVAVWDLDTRNILPIKLPSNLPITMITSATLNSTGNLAAIGTEGGNGVVWNVNTGAEIELIYVDDEVDITTLAFSPDNKRLAYGSRRGDLLLVNLPHNQQSAEEIMDAVSVHTSHTALKSGDRRLINLTFSADSRSLLSRDQDGHITQWHLFNEKEASESTLDGFNVVAESNAFSADGKMLAVGTENGMIGLRFSNGNPPLAAKKLAGSEWVSFALSPDGRILYAVRSDGSIIRWETETWQPIEKQWSSSNRVPGRLAINADGSVLVLANPSGGVTLLNTENSKTLAMLSKAKPVSASDPVTLPSNDLISLDMDHTSNPLRSIAISPDDQWLAEENVKKGFTLWHLPTQHHKDVALKSEKIWQTPGDSLKLAFVGQDKLAILRFALNNSRVELWDIANMTIIGDPLDRWGNPGAVKSVSEYLKNGRALAVSNNGHWLAAGSFREHIQLWDLSAKNRKSEVLERKVLEGKVQEASSLAFTRDGEMLAAFASKHGIVLWDTTSRRRLGILAAKNLQLSSLAFDPKGRWIVALDRGEILIWENGIDSWRTIACLLANHNLSLTEWNEYLGAERPCENTCPELPNGCKMGIDLGTSPY